MAPGSELGGCLNCYAARQALRQAGSKRTTKMGTRTGPQPYTGLVRMTQNGPRWTGKVVLVEDALEVPLQWRKPARIFVDSMSDLFHESLAFEDIARILRVMIRADWHTYQILTKRAERLREFSEWRMKTQSPYPMPQHIWFGVSIENQPTADRRIAELLRVYMRGVRFVSYEPALGPVDFSPWVVGHEVHAADLTQLVGAKVGCCRIGWTPPLDWVIVGGESGPCARPFDLAWARSAIAQCKAAGVACFVKQLGARPILSWPRQIRGMRLKDRKGGDMSEWPEDLRVREFPK